MMYGMGASSIATSIGCTKNEAQELVDKFFKGFPKVKEWIDKTQESCRKLGYVEDLWGRRRRLPDILLPEYKIEEVGASKVTFNPILGCKGLYQKEESAKVKKYRKQLSELKQKWQDKAIIDKAKKDGVIITSNTSKIALNERQCVNARIQGGAATLTKLAMIKIHNDKLLNEWGFRLSIAVHDELIGEVPEEHAEECVNRVCKLMIDTAAEQGIIVPMKCDPTIETSWYETEYASVIQKEYNGYLKDNMTEEEALENIFKDHEETSIEKLKEIIKNKE